MPYYLDENIFPGFQEALIAQSRDDERVDRTDPLYELERRLDIGNRIDRRFESIDRRFGEEPARSSTRNTPELTPEVTTSILGKLGNAGLGTLGVLGETLDAGGRLGRGAIAEIGSALGFEKANPESEFDLRQGLGPSHWLGITDRNKETTERNLLTQFLGAPAEDKGDGWKETAWDVADIATGIFTDPLTYVTGGLLKGSETVAGAVARKAVPRSTFKSGALQYVAKRAGFDVGAREAAHVVTPRMLLDYAPDFLKTTKLRTELFDAAKKSGVNWDDIADVPLRTGVSVKAPLMKQADLFPRYGRVHARAVDMLGDALIKSPIIGEPLRYGRAAFHKMYGNVAGYWEQKIMQRQYAQISEASREAMQYFNEFTTARNEALEEFTKDFGSDILNYANPHAIPGVAHQPKDIVEFPFQLDPRYSATSQTHGVVMDVGPAESKVWWFNPHTHEGKELLVDNSVITKHTASKDLEKVLRDSAIEKKFDDISKHYMQRQNLDEAFQEVYPSKAGSYSADFEQKIGELNNTVQRTLPRLIDVMQSKGLRVGEIKGNIDPATGEAGYYFLPREVSEKMKEFFVDENPALRDRVFNTRVKHMESRNPATSHIPDTVLNKILADPDVRAKDASSATAAVLMKYGKYLGHGEFRDPLEHAKQIVEYAGEKSKNLVDQDRGMYTLMTSRVMLNYYKQMTLADTAADAVHDVIWKNMKTTGTVPLFKVFKDAGMDPDQALNYLSSITKKTRAELDTLGLDADVNKAVTASLQIMTNPEFKRTFAGILGSSIEWAKDMTNWWKSAHTQPWPGFVVRNVASGQGVNLTSGIVRGLRDLKDYTATLLNVKKIAKEGVPEELLKELEENGVFDPRMTGTMDITDLRSPFASKAPDVVFDVWHPIRSSIDTFRRARDKANLEVANRVSRLTKIAGAASTPLGMQAAKVGKPLAEMWESLRRAGGIPVEIGKEANYYGEFLNRVTPYVYLRNKGWSAAAAAEQVNKMQFDYRDLSRFEKTYLRGTLIPFYTFSRKMAGLLAETVFDEPAGALAQVIKHTAKARNENEPLPEYISKTTSIPIKNLPFGLNALQQNKPGITHYLTGFGFAHEDPLQFGPSLKSAGLEALSRVTPLLKYPLEAATGEVFFQQGPGGGRQLEDLDPLLGRIGSNISYWAGHGGKDADAMKTNARLEHIVANSPLSRVFTTLRTLTDVNKSVPTKLLNLGTGVRISTVTPRSRESVLSESIKREAKKYGGYREFSNWYIPKKAKEEMSVQERLEADRLAALQSLLADVQRRRKKRQGL